MSARLLQVTAPLSGRTFQVLDGIRWRFRFPEEETTVDGSVADPEAPDWQSYTGEESAVAHQFGPTGGGEFGWLVTGEVVDGFVPTAHVGARALPVTCTGRTWFVEALGTELLVQLADRLLDVTEWPKRYSLEA